MGGRYLSSLISRLCKIGWGYWGGLGGEGDAIAGRLEGQLRGLRGAGTRWQDRLSSSLL